MIEAELFDGTILEFPEGTAPEVIQQTVKKVTMQRRTQAPISPEAQARADAANAEAERLMGTPAPPTPAGPGLQIAASGADGFREGVSMVAGAPVDLINNAPRLLNLLPGEQGFTTITDNPVGGREDMDWILRAAGLVPDFAPDTPAERVVNRVGQELGATTVPLAGVYAKAAGTALPTINRMAATPSSVSEGLAASFLQPAAVNPVGLAGREAMYATAAGTGAGIANEFAGENAGPLSDFAGSLAGVGATAIAGGTTSALYNLGAGALGRPAMMDNVAGEVVADRLINNSTRMQQQHAETGRVDTTPLVETLRRPASIEDIVPGYRANIGDRTQDPSLSTFAFNTDSVSPGAANARRTQNEAAIGEKMTAIAPQGDPARFRADLQSGVDGQIASAVSDEEIARNAFDTAAAPLAPAQSAEARGAAVRGSLDEALLLARNEERAAWANVQGEIDPAPLAAEFDSIYSGLTLAEKRIVDDARAAIDTPNALTPDAPEGPVPSSVLDAYGRPMMKAPQEVMAMTDLSEVTSLRSEFTTAIRQANAAGDPNKARILDQFVQAIDGHMDSVPELRDALAAARQTSFDLNERFTRRGTPIAETLATRPSGGPLVPDSRVAPQFIQPNEGHASVIDRVLAETGPTQSAAAARTALQDQILADVQGQGLLDKPERLTAYLDQYSAVFDKFPDLRKQFGTAAGLRTKLAEAQTRTADTTKRLTTPGRSAEATYLREVEDPAAAVRAATRSPDPRKAVADLVATAGTPQARADLRAALWEEVKRSGRMDAPGITGETRWNGKVLTRMFDDPKFAAAAEELWKDNPEDLASIKTFFSALSTAEGSTRSRLAGSSGTPQALSGKFDAALSTASIASRARSVQRNQLSPTIAVVDVLSTWLRNKSAQVQSRAIDNLTAAVVNNPGLAADLLERYNPATAAAFKAMVTQKYGMRVTQALEFLEDGSEDDETTDAIMRDAP